MAGHAAIIDLLVVCAAAQEHDVVYPKVATSTDAQTQEYGRVSCMCSRDIPRTRRWRRGIRVRRRI